METWVLRPPGQVSPTPRRSTSIRRPRPTARALWRNAPCTSNALGTSSGSDVIGMTHPGTNFFFGDLAEGAQPGGGNYSSFITILNPVGGQTATVTANYYAGGN